MGDTKMLRAIVDTVGEIRKDVQYIKKGMREMEVRLTKEIRKVDARVDTLGKQLAYLEDDAPTTRDFHRLEKRVTKLEQQANKN